MKLISCNQEMGDSERLLCPGAPQGPAWYKYHDGIFHDSIYFSPQIA